MKITFGFVVVSGGLTGILSFSCLALAIGTENWYIIEDKRANHTDPTRSNFGLWVVTDGMANIFIMSLPMRSFEFPLIVARFFFE